MDGHRIRGQLFQELAVRRIHIEPKLGLNIRNAMIDRDNPLFIGR